MISYTFNVPIEFDIVIKCSFCNNPLEAKENGTGDWEVKPCELCIVHYEETGWKQGHKEGYKEGETCGYSLGRKYGYEEGHLAGLIAGLEEGDKE